MKDKRKVVQSLVQKLRNRGFSVTDLSPSGSPKFAGIGFCYAGASASDVEAALRDAERLFWGDFEILDFSKELVDYENPGESLFTDDYDDPRE